MTAGHNLAAATDVIISGDSAGGIASWLHVDRVAERLPRARVTNVPIAGYYFYAYPYTGPSATPMGLVDFSPANWPKLVELWNATADDSCREQNPEPASCMLANYSLPYITSAAFIIESQTDEVGMHTYSLRNSVLYPRRSVLLSWYHAQTPS